MIRRSYLFCREYGTISEMSIDIWHIIIYFLVYSVLGWVWETIYVSYLERRFVYRGFLTGPYCPIYGFGVLLLLTVLKPLNGSPWALFAVGLVVMSILEYATSYVLEKVFHQRWWDYSNELFNIRGRIALKSSLFWGIMCVVIVTLLQPYVVKLADTILTVGMWLPILIVAVFVVDATHTIVRLTGLNVLLAQVQQAAGQRADTLAHAIREQVAASRRTGRPRLTERRILRAYPHATRTQMQNYAEIRDEPLKLRKQKRA